MPQSSYSTMSIWMSCVHQVLLKEKIDADALFEKVGVSLDYAYKKDLRVPVEEARKVWFQAILATGNDAFGLEVAQLLIQTSTDPVRIAIESSRTMGEAMDRLIKFYAVVSNGVLLYQSKEATSDTVLAPIGNTPLPAKEAVDAALALIFKCTESVSTVPIKALRIEFMREEPKNRKAFEDYFKCPLYFGCELNRICYPLDLEDKPLLHSNESLSQVMDNHLDKSVRDLAIPPFTQKVSALVCELLLEQNVSLNLVAEKMQLGSRTLQRNLSQENTSFKALLDVCKLATAKQLLKKQHSITDVSFILGFSSPSNFVRFFKRFESKSPGEFQNTAPD